MPNETTTNCPDCGVTPGQTHKENCDIARCAHTGEQRLQCGHEDCHTTWTGQWPGDAECAEYGWWIRMDSDLGWVPCAADHPEATEDLNRLNTHAHWDANAQRYIKN